MTMAEYLKIVAEWNQAFQDVRQARLSEKRRLKPTDGLKQTMIKDFLGK